MTFGIWRDSRIFRFVIGRKRLLASTVAGLILMALLPSDFRWSTRFILAWDLTALLYITLIMWMIRCSTVEDCHDHAALNDEGDWAILLLVVGAVAASFICIAVELPVLQSPGHSVALVNLRPLLARDGVLEQLKARGLEVHGPGQTEDE